LQHVKKYSRVALVLCVAAAAALATDFAALKPQGYVSDFAQVISPESRAQLEQYCAALEKSTGVQFALVTVPSLDGQPVEDVANDMFRKWGVGKKGEDNGLLLLLSIQDRRSRLEVGYGLEPIITDGDAGSLLRAMRPYLRAERYGDAMLVAANQIGSEIAAAKGVSIQEPAPAPRQPRRERGIPTGALSFIVMFIVFAVLSSALGGRRGPRGGGGLGGALPWLILGSMMRGGRGGGFGGSGGGFGGFDSGGGGFGGFGGGDSGGGGASGSW
jgi:uncharacterized protein